MVVKSQRFYEKCERNNYIIRKNNTYMLYTTKLNKNERQYQISVKKIRVGANNLKTLTVRVMYIIKKKKKGNEKNNENFH